MKRIILAGILALGGCHMTDVFKPPTQSYVTPDGRPGYIIHCGGVMFSMATCYSAAREMCGGKDYDLLDKSVTSRDDTATQNRNIEIACKR
jgi:hypothetical protein